MSSPVSDRRAFLRAAAVAPLVLAGCARQGPWHAIDVAGTSPDLVFTMRRASDGREVTQADYRGDIVMLYLGYTFCPDACPTTLANVQRIFHRLGKRAEHIRFLFVTVDPNRDTLPVLRKYLANFGPDIAGLRGTPDQLASLARRFRLVYSVHPSPDPEKYDVSHSDAIYVFDGTGAARLLIPSLATAHPDIEATVQDLTRLAEGSEHPGWLARLRRLV